MENEKEIKEIVVARLQTLPDGKEISIGEEGDFTKEDLIKHVENGDEIGQKMIEIEMNFLRALKDGLLYA